jgi:hypothetical protein
MRSHDYGWWLAGLAALACTSVVKPMMAQNRDAGFVIDSTRPSVYIEFERVAKRKPVSDEEVSSGVWLRLMNNTRVPIRVMTFEPGTGDPGVGVMDEVVQVNNPVGFGPSGTNVETLSYEQAGSPKGYSLDVGSSATIPGGDSLLFGVPLNHVGQSWYLRVRFEFELPPTKTGRQPYSYADFTWMDVPRKDRAAWAVIGRQRKR